MTYLREGTRYVRKSFCHCILHVVVFSLLESYLVHSFAMDQRGQRWGRGRVVPLALDREIDPEPIEEHLDAFIPRHPVGPELAQP